MDIIIERIKLLNTKLINFIGSFYCLLAISSLSGAASAATSRSDAPEVKRGTSANVVETHVSRSATKRPTTVGNSRAGASNVTPGVVTSRSAARQAVSTVNTRQNGTTTARSAAVPTTSTARSAATSTTMTARSAANTSNVSRAGMSRATAIYDDVSKMGTGYATCRDAYNTCMDQFCAKSNDTYRRCFCSSRFTEFQDTELALDEAKTLLMRFQDTSLDAVDKTAAEVAAMYSASVGEKAIKNDTSAAQKTLNEIGDLLSGKKKATKESTTSLGVMSLDFSTEIGDIWGEGGSSSIFGGSSTQSMVDLEGQALYNAAHKQCAEMISNSCENNAVFTMARSSYSVLITQDCNAYEKKVNTQRETVTKTVREAEKILREARLEEYRAHNSADVNECITKVKTAIIGENACGANYKRCLDDTGIYINQNTGEPIYSPRLFQLSTILNLDEGGNVIQSNARFNKFLDSKKMYAETALDTCRGKADTVWEEFKRTAIIEIAQAQDQKIEEVKNTCVSTMAECYDTQSGALASFDNTTAQSSGALNAYAARQMCADKVSACAALYAGPNDKACTFDNNGKLTNPGKCGLTALLSFVNLVDTVKVSEGCKNALTNYATELCTPDAKDKGAYPYKCRSMSLGAKKSDTNTSGNNTNTLWGVLESRADLYCKNPTDADDSITDDSGEVLESIVEDIQYRMSLQLAQICTNNNGFWVEPEDVKNIEKEYVEKGTAKSNTAFDYSVYGGSVSGQESWGKCYELILPAECFDSGVECDPVTGNHTLSEEWYSIKCNNIMNGYWKPETQTCMYIGE